MPSKLQAYNLSIQDVINSVSSQNVEIPGGNLTEGPRQLLLRTMGKYKNVEDFNKVIVATPMGKPVYFPISAKFSMGLKNRQA